MNGKERLRQQDTAKAGRSATKLRWREKAVVELPDSDVLNCLS